MNARSITVVASELLGRPGTGGAGTADSFLAVALARHGHRVDLLRAPGRDIGELSREWADTYSAVGVQVRMLAASERVAPGYLGPAYEILRALEERPPDVVVVDDWRGLGFVALRARQLGRSLSGAAFVVHCHGPGRVLAEFAQKVPDTLGRFGEEVMERASLQLADAVVSPSVWLLEWMRVHGWPLPPSAAVIQYVGESAALGRAPPRAAADGPLRRLAFFGQLREGKGIRIFLSALEQVEPQLLQGVELVFLGRETRRWTRERITEALSPSVLHHLAALRVQPSLDRAEALAELTQPGTLAVVPSLLDNAPNTVSECIERGVPFVSTRTGGIPELIAEEDRDRVLCAPAPAPLAAALTRALGSRPAFAPARPARDPAHALEAWLELVGAVAPSPSTSVPPPSRISVVSTGGASTARARRLAESTRSVQVEVIESRTRCEGTARASGDWVVFLDEDDRPTDGLLDTLAAAQVACGADVVTPAVKPATDPDGLQLFLGDPGALGLVENAYGVLGLVRRTLLNGCPPPEGSVDPDWPLFARLALGGARIVSIPEPLALHGGRVGHAGDVPGEGLAVLQAFEELHGRPLPDLPQLAATLAAERAPTKHTAPPGRQGLLAAKGDALARRVGARLRRGRTRRPRTFPTRTESIRLHLVDRRRALHYLHLGKTGGTALKQALLEHADASACRLLLHGHDVTLSHVPRGERFMFVVRDPIARFVSAFNGRLREDRPRYHYPWKEEERVAFAVFETPDELAIALSSEDEQERCRAEEAMHGIGHVNTSYWTTFGDEAALRARLSDLFFVGFTERLSEDFELLKRKLGLPEEAELPGEEVAAHRTPPGFETDLSDLARRNLARWYARDLAFVELCRELAPLVNDPSREKT